MTDDFKTIATVRDTARLCGFSPARFFQLQKAGIMPLPVYDITTHRPHYTEEQQRQCLEVRRTNCGINQQPILFYSPRIQATPQASRRRSPRQPATPHQKSEHAGLVDALRDLGLTTVTAAQVSMAVKAIYPKGIGQIPEPEVIRGVFLHLRRQDRGDSVGG